MSSDNDFIIMILGDTLPPLIIGIKASIAAVADTASLTTADEN